MNIESWLVPMLCLGGVMIALLSAVVVRQSSMQRKTQQLLQAHVEWAQHQELLFKGLEEQLRELQLGSYRETLESRSYIVERLIRSHQLHQKSGHQLQQSLLARFAALYQALERRFGEMHKNLGDDAACLRTDLMERFELLQRNTAQQLSDGGLAQQRSLGEIKEAFRVAMEQHRRNIEARHGEALATQQSSLNQGMDRVVKQVGEALSRHSEQLGKRIEGLTATTETRLSDISAQVERRLNEGFKKTTETFTRVLSHLTRIDEAQKKITELSSNVVSLQEVLADKRSRGAFGEVQLHALVRNLMPENSFSLQHTLSNNLRVDCMLFLPEPTGNIAVDAKFPLESFRRMTDGDVSNPARGQATSQFRVDIRKHIRDIAGKYIVPGETCNGAVMFIPAEAVFAEIHARFPDLVEESYRLRVWLVSPTTMMAILTTARAVLKDAATREQVDIIQEHLQDLAQDFGRFQQRMDNLARHIHQAGRDVDEVNVSARKISGRFEKIEQVELQERKTPPLSVFKEGEPLPERKLKE